VVLISAAYHNEICFAFADGDFQFWSTTGASFDVNKDWKVAVEEKLKFVHDGGHLRYHHTDLGFTYKAFEKNRIYSGVSFELSEGIESELYYVWQSSKYFDRWQDLSALGLQLKFRL